MRLYGRIIDMNKQYKEVYHAFNAEEAEKYIGKCCMFMDSIKTEPVMDTLYKINYEDTGFPFENDGGENWRFISPIQKVTKKEAEKLLQEQGIYVSIKE